MDFSKVDTQVRANRFTPLNINAYLGITIGSTEQQQEPYNHFEGSIAECRLWDKAVCYSSKEKWAATDYLTPGLIAMWGFWNQAGKDFSPVGNDLDVSGDSFAPWSL